MNWRKPFESGNQEQCVCYSPASSDLDGEIPVGTLEEMPGLTLLGPDCNGGPGGGGPWVVRVETAGTFGERST